MTTRSGNAVMKPCAASVIADRPIAGVPPLIVSQPSAEKVGHARRVLGAPRRGVALRELAKPCHRLLIHTPPACYFFGAAGGAGGVGGASAFQVSRMYCHFPSFLRDTDRNLPDSTTAPLMVAV